MELFEICETLGRCLKPGLLPVDGLSKKLFSADLLRGYYGVSEDSVVRRAVLTWSLVFDPGRAP